MSKKCIFCDETNVKNFYKNGRSYDGYWAWCKNCEKKAREIEKRGEMHYVLSFSGGKDSTALLIKILENKMPLDRIIYFDCEDFEWPEMHDHIEKVKKTFDIDILTVKTQKPFEQYLQELGWATPNLRWCTNEKINMMRRFLRFYRPCTQYIGYAADETKRIQNALGKNKTRKRDFNLHYSYPLVDMGITEQQALDICKSYGFNWGGMYKDRKRLSCWCCPLQRKSAVELLKNTRPELYTKLKYYNSLVPEDKKWTIFSEKC